MKVYNLIEYFKLPVLDGIQKYTSTKPPEDIYELNRQLVEQECKHQNVTSDPLVDDADWMKLVYVDDRQKLLYCLVSKVGSLIKYILYKLNIILK